VKGVANDLNNEDDDDSSSSSGSGDDDDDDDDGDGDSDDVDDGNGYNDYEDEDNEDDEDDDDDDDDEDEEKEENAIDDAEYVSLTPPHARVPAQTDSHIAAHLHHVPATHTFADTIACSHLRRALHSRTWAPHPLHCVGFVT
jgi:hypothetical protein